MTPRERSGYRLFSSGHLYNSLTVYCVQINVEFRTGARARTRANEMRREQNGTKDNIPLPLRLRQKNEARPPKHHHHHHHRHHHHHHYHFPNLLCGMNVDNNK